MLGQVQMGINIYTGGKGRQLISQQLIKHENPEFTKNTHWEKKIGHFLPTFKITPCRNTLVCKGPRKGRPVSSKKNYFEIKTAPISSYPKDIMGNIPKIRPD